MRGRGYWVIVTDIGIPGTAVRMTVITARSHRGQGSKRGMEVLPATTTGQTSQARSAVGMHTAETCPMSQQIPTICQ